MGHLVSSSRLSILGQNEKHRKWQLPRFGLIDSNRADFT